MITSLALLIALNPIPPQAPIKCKPDDPEVCVVYLKKGEPAPFDGILYTNRAAAKQTALVEQVEERIKTAADKERDLGRVEVEKLKAIHEIDAKAWADQRKLIVDTYDRALEDRKPGILEHPVFVATVSVLATAGAITLSAWAYGQVQK
jgi:hypothetical protein